MKQVQWGLLSTANINQKLITAIRSTQRGQLSAIASRDPDKAKGYATKWDIPHHFGSYQEMLDSGVVDVVYISLPNHLHAEWSIKAMQAGLHVLCEKPFAITLDEVDRMISTSQKTGKVLAEAFMYRHHPQTKIVGEWVKNGKLGNILLISGTFTFQIKDQNDVRMISEYGGGCLWDVGIYPLSFAQFVYGASPQSVFGTQKIGETGIDEVFAGQMQYSSGGLAQISSSFRSPYYNHVIIIGTQGRLLLTRPFNMLDEDRHLIFYSPDGVPQEIPVPEQELYLGEVEDMHSAILEGCPPYLTLQETRNHVRTVLALYQSAKVGKNIILDN
jgi:xylose dehydrogenase (NAD/NADP)